VTALLTTNSVRAAVFTGEAASDDGCSCGGGKNWLAYLGPASPARATGSVVPGWLENVFEDLTRRDHLASNETEQGPKEKIGITLVVDAKINVDLEKLRRDAWESLLGADISYTKNSQTKTKELTAMEATKIT
jgi:hypothetical protein